MMMIRKTIHTSFAACKYQKDCGFAIPATSNLSVLAISFTFLTPFLNK
jgi:hypothetical protein